jgi:thiol:disulfide interchange protein DsbA
MSIRGAVMLSLLFGFVATIAGTAAIAAPKASKDVTAATSMVPSGPAPVLGTDYFMIDPPVHETGKFINVVEVFGYSCPHCAHFQPYVDAWKKKQPAYVKFSYLPAAFGGIWDAFARAYYTADAMGVLQKSHNGIFNAIHVQHRPITNIEDIAALYADYGVDKNVFASTMQSFPITSKVQAAQAQALRWGVDGTPTIVVAGRYRVMITDSGEEAFLRKVDWFVAKERAERKLH